MAQDRKQWKKVCRQCRADDINKDIGPYAANSSTMNMDTSYPCSCRCSFNAKETSHDTDDSVMVHNSKATEKWPTLLTASVEELSATTEIVHGFPTTAPLVPLDFLLVNIVPQDTATILKMGGYRVTRCVCLRVCTMRECRSMV